MQIQSSQQQQLRRELRGQAKPPLCAQSQLNSFATILKAGMCFNYVLTRFVYGMLHSDIAGAGISDLTEATRIFTCLPSVLKKFRSFHYYSQSIVEMPVSGNQFCFLCS